LQSGAERGPKTAPPTGPSPQWLSAHLLCLLLVRNERLQAVLSWRLVAMETVIPVWFIYRLSDALRLSVVFLGPRANTELVPKLHVALHASHAALQILTFQNFSP
jgi:hypothetical protein